MRSAKKSILVISNMDDDLHAAVVADELKKRGEDVLCLDPKDLVDGSIDFEIAHDSFLSVQTKDVSFSASEIKSVLYRRPSLIAVSNAVEDDYRDVVHEEWRSCIQGFWEVLELQGALFVSHPASIRRSETKMRQLAVALQVGLKVPRTSITNRRESLDHLFRECNSRIAIKKLKSHNISVNDHNALFVTKVLHDVDEISEGSLALCPTIFQEFIEKAYDARLIIVGSSVFAVKIHSQADDTTRVDYRAGKERTDLPGFFGPFVT